MSRTAPRPLPILPLDPARLGPVPGARVAVVGGCGGMGRALVRALQATGVKVAVLDLARSLADYPPAPDVPSFEMDGSDAASVAAAFQRLGAMWPALDGCCNLIGFMKGWQPLAELTPELFDEVIAGNLRAHFLVARAALPLLRASGAGTLVNVSSTLAMEVGKGYGHYSAAKAGIVALTKGLAQENAPAVRVNALAPGLTDTAFLQGGTGREAVFDAMDPQRYASRVPLKRIAQADDMVGPLLFLLGPASRYVNGETLVADGGVYQR